jgi:hypothetical protein
VGGLELLGGHVAKLGIGGAEECAQLGEGGLRGFPLAQGIDDGGELAGASGGFVVEGLGEDGRELLVLDGELAGAFEEGIWEGAGGVWGSNC